MGIHPAREPGAAPRREANELGATGAQNHRPPRFTRDARHVITRGRAALRSIGPAGLPLQGQWPHDTGRRGGKGDMTICCFGAIHLDTLVEGSRPFRPETSTPARFRERPGGVATNVARGLRRLGLPTLLAGATGADPDGDRLRRLLVDDGLDLAVIRRADVATGRYIAFHDPDGSLPAAAVDATITDTLTPDLLASVLPAAAGAEFWFVDANLPASVLAALADAAGSRFLAADAVSQAKAPRLAPILARLDCVFLNRGEAAALLDGAAGGGEPLASPMLARRLLARGVRACVLSDGPRPLVVASDQVEMVFEIPPVAEIRDVTGAGDALIAGTLRGLAAGLALVEAAACGLRAARQALAGHGAVAETLSWESLSRGDLRTLDTRTDADL